MLTPTICRDASPKSRPFTDIHTHQKRSLHPVRSNDGATTEQRSSKTRQTFMIAGQSISVSSLLNKDLPCLLTTSYHDTSPGPDDMPKFSNTEGTHSHTHPVSLELLQPIHKCKGEQAVSSNIRGTSLQVLAGKGVMLDTVVSESQCDFRHKIIEARLLHEVPTEVPRSLHGLHRHNQSNTIIGSLLCPSRRNLSVH